MHEQVSSFSLGLDGNLPQEANEEHEPIHSVLMVLHVITAIGVFSILGYALMAETKRMERLQVARDITVSSKKRSRSQPGLIDGDTSIKKTVASVSSARKAARRFAAEYALYRVDYFLSTASFAKPLLLLLLTYIIIILGGVFYSYISGIPMLEAIWMSWTMVADPGAHGDTRGTLLRGVSLTLTLAGMLVFALMIGIVADGVSNFLDSLKQGHAGVVEIEHTLILGWSQKTLPCIREICLANESLNGRGVIVVLADREKQAMEEDLRAAFTQEDLRGTLVVFRSGKVTSEKDLKKVSARQARSIIVLADMSIDADASDARAVRVVMCLAKIFQETESTVNGHLVVELCDIDNKDLVPLIAPINCEVVVSHDMIGRMMIACARQPGLTQVLQQILTFDGAEFYFKNWPELTGKSFGEISFLFPDAIVLGIKPQEREDALKQLERSKSQRVDINAKRKRKVILNPPDDYVVGEKDLILVLAEDDDCYAPCKTMDPEARSAFQTISPQQLTSKRGAPENFLFCGSRRDMDDMIIELDQMVSPGSTLTLMSNMDIEKQKKRLAEGGLELNKLQNLVVQFVLGNQVLRRNLEKLPLETYSSILILADEEYETAMDEADSRTLTCLLLIRDIITKRLNLHDAPTVESGKIRVMRMNSAPAAASSNDERAESVGSFSPPKSRLSGMLGAPSFSSRRLKLKSPIMNPVSLTRRPSSTGGSDVYVETGVHGGMLPLAPSSLSPAARLASPSFNKKSIETDVWSSGSSSSLLTAGGAGNEQQNEYSAVAKTVILCEILDTQTKALMPIAKVTDNLLSNEIISSCLSLIAESASTNDILSELLQPEGNDIKLVSSLDYGEQGEEISLWALSARLRSRNEILLGYKLANDAKSVLNPQDKAIKIALNVRTMLIIISEAIYS